MPSHGVYPPLRDTDVGCLPLPCNPQAASDNSQNKKLFSDIFIGAKKIDTQCLPTHSAAEPPAPQPAGGPPQPELRSMTVSVVSLAGPLAAAAAQAVSLCNTSCKALRCSICSLHWSDAWGNTFAACVLPKSRM